MAVASTPSRFAIFDRDGKRCYECGCTDRPLTVHHCLPIHVYPKALNKIWNLVALCQPCHVKLERDIQMKQRYVDIALLRMPYKGEQTIEVDRLNAEVEKMKSQIAGLKAFASSIDKRTQPLIPLSRFFQSSVYAYISTTSLTVWTRAKRIRTSRPARLMARLRRMTRRAAPPAKAPAISPSAESDLA